MKNRVVAFLRGINVGGNRKIGMKALQTLFVSLGHADASTYIQSGNVIFTSSADRLEPLGTQIEKQISESLKLEVKVVLRRQSDLARIAKVNPFLEEGVETSRLHVVFLSHAPPAAAARRLDPQRSPPDQFMVKGQEVYLATPNGIGKSKLTVDYFERQLNAAATIRNWNTVTKLLALMQRTGTPAPS